MTSPSLCVVTPSYNQGRFIERTIRSVLDQDIPDLDYFVLDGGSTDETVEVLQREGDPRLRWVSQPDGGQADAVNKGMAQTTAEIIGWINSDDVYYPGALAAVRDHFAAHPEVDVVYGDAEHIDENDKIIDRYYSEAWDVDRLRDVCFLCQPAVFFRRRAYERCGPLDDQLHFCMDYEYWLRLSRHGLVFSYLQRDLAGSRLYATNKTLGQRQRVHTEINDMLKKALGRVPDRWLSNWAHVRLEERGLRRAERPRRFMLFVSLLCWVAALRWNRRIPSSLMRMTGPWIRGAFSPR